MAGWLQGWGILPLPFSNGMMTPQKTKQLDAAVGSDKQRLFLEGMIKAEMGAIELARAETSSGENSETIALANGISGRARSAVASARRLLDAT